MMRFSSDVPSSFRFILLVVVLLGTAPPAAAADFFVDAAAETGLDFEHVNGMTGDLYFVEMVGPGGALFDFDDDGDLDVFLVQGHPLGPKAEAGRASWPTDRLFRNELISESGGGKLRFTDVTAKAGFADPAHTGYGMGVAAGDYDNDGHVDLYVTNWGPNQLWQNQGDGTFRPVGKASGTDDPGWGTSAAFFDFDDDGWLDLFVANYARYTYENHKPCYAPSSAPDYCGPLAYQAEADRLYRNRGDGTFEPVNLGPAPKAPALGVVTADFDGDGRVDLYVANDQHENNLWLNQGGGRFTDEALLAGAAVNLAGKAEASMGVDAADFDGDGDEDIFLTHLSRETNTLYENDGNGIFDDATASIGLGAPSWAFTAFGTAWLDYDGDGWLDLFAANGEVKQIQAQLQAGDPYPLHQPNQLFHNLEGKRFEETTAAAGAVFQLSEVSRGVAVGDVDNDGDPDVLLVNNRGPARLLRNDGASPAGWLGLRLVGGEKTPRDMLGARTEVQLSSGRSLWRRVRADASYCSANDPRILVAIPRGESVKAVRVLWPGGGEERWTGLVPGAYHLLRRGEGKAPGKVSPPPPKAPP